MKKRFALFLCAALAAVSLSVTVYADVPDPLEISGEAAILVDAGTGQVLYEKNIHEKLQPASITKILTALLVLETLDPEETLTASPAAVDIPYWGASAYLEDGETLTVDEAMYAMMLRSANDAANVLAEGVSGSMEAFSERMNERARELGAENTHFVNANGLPNRGHVTTAYDMARITMQAIRTPGFLEYSSEPYYYMDATNKSGERIFTNTHRMLLSDYAVYNPEVIAGKTGYTTQSGYTLVTIAQRGERTLICVILKSAGYYADTQQLLDFGFDEFTPYTHVLKAGEPTAVSIWQGDREAGRAYFYPPQSVSLLLHNSVSVDSLEAVPQLPEHLEIDDTIAAYTAIDITASRAVGLPATLFTVPWEVEVMTFAPPAAETTATPDTPAKPVLAITPVLLTVGGFVLIGVLWFALLLVRRRNRQHRILRRNRAYRAGARRYGMRAHH